MISALPYPPHLQKRLLKEAQQQRLLRQAAEKQQQEANTTSDAVPGQGATFSMEQPIEAIIDAVLSASVSPYARLGLPPHAPREACRRSYLQLALRLHPDKCEHPRAMEAFTVIDEAFRSVDGING